MELYKTGRDFLKSRGYRQLSMRHFVSTGYVQQQEKTDYSCQEDEMVGMGCGARSYTGGFHYSSFYAVSRKGIAQILNDYTTAPSETFAYAHNGIHLDEEDKKRRLIIKTLLLAEGLDLAYYRKLFSTEAKDDFVELREFVEQGLAEIKEDKMTLTDEGMAYSDAIGPMMISAKVRRLMESFDYK